MRTPAPPPPPKGPPQGDNSAPHSEAAPTGGSNSVREPRLASPAASTPRTGLWVLLGLFFVAFLAAGAFTWYAARSAAKITERLELQAKVAEWDTQIIRGSRTQEAAPVVSPDEVLSEAEAMKGEVFSKVHVQAGEKSIELPETVALLPAGNLGIEIAAFATPLDEATSNSLGSAASLAKVAGEAPPLLVRLELDPFAAGCNVLAVKKYSITTTPGGAAALPSTTLEKLRSSPDATELRFLNCTRKKGAVVELSLLATLKDRSGVPVIVSMHAREKLR